MCDRSREKRKGDDDDDDDDVKTNIKQMWPWNG